MTISAAGSVERSQSPTESAFGVPVATASGWPVLVAGTAGLIASLVLTVEKIRLLSDSAYVPSCNINPVLSCGSVMATEQASVLDLPNSLIGIVAFTVVGVTGLLTVAKVPLPRWYWLGLTAGLIGGAAFVHWLIFVSLYRIGALCPYCMVVWAVTVPLLVAVASVALTPQRPRSVLEALYRWRWSLTALWFVILTILIAIRFRDYWSTLV